jgi:large subunit ribosomal protein L17
MRFAMTARTIARERSEGRDVNKVTRFRKDGEEELEDLVERMSSLEMPNRRTLDLESRELRWGGKPTQRKEGL